MTTERATTERPTSDPAEQPEGQLDTRDLRAAQDAGGGMTVEVERRDRGEPMTDLPAATNPTAATSATAATSPAAASPAATDRPVIQADPATAAPLFDEAAGARLRERWLAVQTEFVDEPRAAVEKADSLVAEVLRQLTESFAGERQRLEDAWSHGSDSSDVSTEDLRQAIRRYRSFFDRLLSI